MVSPLDRHPKHPKMLEGERENCCAWNPPLHARGWGRRRWKVVSTPSAVRVPGLSESPQRVLPVPQPHRRWQTELYRPGGSVRYRKPRCGLTCPNSWRSTRWRHDRRPPGYVGYEEGWLPDRGGAPQAVFLLLLDEVEKAHPDVFNIPLQVLRMAA